MQTDLPGHFLAFLFVLVSCSVCGCESSLFFQRFAPRHWQLSSIRCCGTLSKALVSKNSLVLPYHISHFLNLLWELLTEAFWSILQESPHSLSVEECGGAESLRCVISFECVQGLFSLKVIFGWVLIFATSSCWSSDRYFLPCLQVTLSVHCWVFLSQKTAEEEMTLYFCPYLHRTADIEDTVRIIGYALTSGSQLFLWHVCKC